MKHLMKIILIAIFIFSSCTTIQQETCSYGTFRFTQKPDEINISQNLIVYLKSNPSCRFVLRVPIIPNNLAEEDKFINKPLYFSIEKILIDNRYSVIDRSLFEKKISDNISPEKTTDLILELVDFKPVNYYTDKVIPDHNRTVRFQDKSNEITLPQYYYFTGAQVIFKIVDVHSSEIVATFVLNYTPCTKGCKMKYCSSGRVEEIRGEKITRKKRGYKSVDIDFESEMFVDLVKRLVGELKRVTDEK
jgi:hypothetical protein